MIRYHQLEPDRRGDSIASSTIVFLIRKKTSSTKYSKYSCCMIALLYPIAVARGFLKVRTIKE
jgi:hypothetical protein